jgi:hypothetical protein
LPRPQSRGRAKKGFRDERRTILVLDLDEDPFLIARGIGEHVDVSLRHSERPSFWPTNEARPNNSMRR